jgi:hypothetical protein
VRLFFDALRPRDLAGHLGLAAGEADSAHHRGRGRALPLNYHSGLTPTLNGMRQTTASAIPTRLVTPKVGTFEPISPSTDLALDPAALRRAASHLARA